MRTGAYSGGGAAAVLPMLDFRIVCFAARLLEFESRLARTSRIIFAFYPAGQLPDFAIAAAALVLRIFLILSCTVN
jgi:hypothetical protein